MFDDLPVARGHGPVCLVDDDQRERLLIERRQPLRTGKALYAGKDYLGLAEIDLAPGLGLLDCHVIEPVGGESLDRAVEKVVPMSQHQHTASFGNGHGKVNLCLAGPGGRDDDRRLMAFVFFLGGFDGFRLVVTKIKDGTPP